MKYFKKSLSLLLVILTVVTCFVGCNVPKTQNTTSTTQEQTTTKNTDITISDEVEEIVEEVKEQVNNGEVIDTEEIQNSTPKEEATIEEDSLEPDAKVAQENISYDGTITGKGTSLLGKYQGLTYYSQMDNRWGSLPYTIKNDKSQTIKSSGCGPTSAAMIISSSKGAITPPTTVELAIKYGYRTRDNGTAWSYWSFIADFFDFNYYAQTYNYNTMIAKLKTDKNKDGISDYFVVVSCGYGLFTTGGHYIVLMGFNGKIIVYDPYYYPGKFNTPSRSAAGVVVKGNIAYVTESAFKKYGNPQSYWIYSNDSATAKKAPATKTTTVTNNTKVTYKTTVGKIYKLTKLTNLYSKSNLTGTEYTYIKGAEFKVLKHINTKIDYVQSIKTGRKAYINVAYLTTVTAKVNYKTNINQLYRLKSSTNLYSNSNLTGTIYTYKAQTQLKVLKHINVTVDYIYVVKTGRYAYCRVSAFV